VTQMLRAGVKCCGPVSRVLAFTGQRTGSCGSWLTLETRPVHKVGFVREKGKAKLEQCSGARKLVAPCSGEGWGFYGQFNSGLGGGSIGCGFAHELSSMRWSVCPLWGEQTWEHSVYQPHGRFMRPCIISSGSRNVDLELLLRVQGS
jgi:hypothetical protein